MILDELELAIVEDTKIFNYTNIYNSELAITNDRLHIISSWENMLIHEGKSFD